MWWQSGLGLKSAAQEREENLCGHLLFNRCIQLTFLQRLASSMYEGQCRSILAQKGCWVQQAYLRIDDGVQNILRSRSTQIWNGLSLWRSVSFCVSLKHYLFYWVLDKRNCCNCTIILFAMPLCSICKGGRGPCILWSVSLVGFWEIMGNIQKFGEKSVAESIFALRRGIKMVI